MPWQAVEMGPMPCTPRPSSAWSGGPKGAQALGASSRRIRALGSAGQQWAESREGETRHCFPSALRSTTKHATRAHYVAENFPLRVNRAVPKLIMAGHLDDMRLYETFVCMGCAHFGDRRNEQFLGKMIQNAAGSLAKIERNRVLVREERKTEKSGAVHCPVCSICTTDYPKLLGKDGLASHLKFDQDHTPNLVNMTSDRFHSECCCDICQETLPKGEVEWINAKRTYLENCKPMHRPGSGVRNAEENTGLYESLMAVLQHSKEEAEASSSAESAPAAAAGTGDDERVGGKRKMLQVPQMPLAQVGGGGNLAKKPESSAASSSSSGASSLASTDVLPVLSLGTTEAGSAAPAASAPLAARPRVEQAQNGITYEAAKEMVDRLKRELADRERATQEAKAEAAAVAAAAATVAAAAAEAKEEEDKATAAEKDTVKKYAAAVEQLASCSYRSLGAPPQHGAPHYPFTGAPLEEDDDEDQDGAPHYCSTRAPLEHVHRSMSAKGPSLIDEQLAEAQLQLQLAQMHLEKGELEQAEIHAENGMRAMGISL